MSLVIQSSESCNVLFWEGVLELELRKVASLLEKKQTRLFALRNLPFEQKSERTANQIKSLEYELSVFVGLLGVMEKLQNSYIEFTGSVSDRLISLTTQCDWYRKTLIETMAEGGAHRP